jgi:hypothetical protein
VTISQSENCAIIFPFRIIFQALCERFLWAVVVVATMSSLSQLALVFGEMKGPELRDLFLDGAQLPNS